MKKVLLVFALPVLMISILSCNVSPDKMSARIKGMEKKLQETHPADTAQVTELIGAYQSYAAKFHDDTLAPEYLYRAAGLSLSFNKTMQALDLYRNIRVEYPSWKKSPACLFMQGFIFENYIKDLAKANMLYNEFIAKYPHDELTDDAENAIKYLGKPLDEVVKEFEAQNASSDTIRNYKK